ncbi:hypothetical protein ACLB2K_060232 [Fragaria x ananassa]
MNPSHEIVFDYSYAQESMLTYLGDASDPMLMLENKEISLKYTDAHSMMERTFTTIDDVFAYHGGGVTAASAPTRKRGRPVGSTDIVPRKRCDSKAQNDPLIINTMNPSHEIVFDYSYAQESMLTYLGDASDPMLMSENKEISLKYTDAHSMMERTSTTIDDVFAYSVAQDIIDDDEIEPRSVAECQRRADWLK